VVDIAAVARADVNDDAAESGCRGGDLTDVDVDEALADQSAHDQMVSTAGTNGRPVL
jgi:hypothetical protein